MVKKESVTGDVLEIQCDICGMAFDSDDEMDEFICFNYVMGPKSQYPNREIKFDVCQDCMIDRFQEIFSSVETDIEDTTDGLEIESKWEN